MTHRVLPSILCSSLLLSLACNPAAGDDAIDLDGGSGKSDAASAAKILEHVGPVATIEGKFEPGVRVYGYIVEANAGATITVDLEHAVAGDGAMQTEPGQKLDTRIEVHGPFKTTDDRGELIDASDDSDDDVAAPPVTFDVEGANSAKFLVLFTSHEDTGAGSYRLNLTCEGTDFSCRRANFERPCTPGELFVQGGTIEQDTVWDTCTVILPELTTVPDGSTLSIRPGVNVRAILQTRNPNDPFGAVGLQVDGVLQAVGTEDAPIVFEPDATEGTGWMGIRLGANSDNTAHHLEHAFIEHARVAVDLTAGAIADIEDVVINGGVTAPDRRSDAGIRAATGAVATFRRAMVKGNINGLHLNQGEDLTIEDSVVRENNIGVLVTGPGSTNTCNSGSSAQPPQFRDPKIIHSDIIENANEGIRVSGNDVLLQVSNSNIVNNGGLALSYQARLINPETFIRESNIFGNDRSTADEPRTQIETFHRTNELLDLTGNFWQIVANIAPTLASTCSSNPTQRVDMGSFTNKEIADAGPRPDDLIDPVQKGRHHQE